jgi:multidrug efflux pump subunit AcrB
LIRYKEKEEKVDKFTQYIPDFCSYKNQQVREIAKRDIVESAQINYDYYISDKFNYDKLEKWQKKILKKIKKIKVKRIHSSDLLQESGTISTKIVLLPDGQQEHLVKFMISNGVQKIVVNGLSGFVVSFGIILGNWQLGLVYCFAVFVSSISAIIAGADYANYTLRNRYIAKGDLLVEFDNIKDMFINKSQYTDSKLLQNDLNKEPNVV